MTGNKKLDIAKRSSTLAVLAVYLLTTLSFVFLLDKLVPSNTTNTGAKFKTENVRSQNAVQRQDKATFKSNDGVISHSLQAVVLYVHFTFNKASFTEIPANRHGFRTANNNRFSYLVLRTLRI